MKLMNAARIETIRKWPTVKLINRCQRNMVLQGTITKANGKFWDHTYWGQEQTKLFPDLLGSRFIVMRMRDSLFSNQCLLSSKTFCFLPANLGITHVFRTLKKDFSKKTTQIEYSKIWEWNICPFWKKDGLITSKKTAQCFHDLKKDGLIAAW